MIRDLKCYLRVSLFALPRTWKGSVTHSSLAELFTKDQIAQKAGFWISYAEAWLSCWDIRTC